MLDKMSRCGTAEENTFGPRVAGNCLAGFDFTLLFEESILTLLPLCVFLLVAPYRIHVLSKRPKVARRSWLFYVKLICYAVYIIFQISLLAVWAVGGVVKTKATLATTAILVGGFTLLMAVSIQEHERSVRPSTFLNLFLGLSTLLDIARVRTLFYLPSNSVVAIVYCTSFFVKLLLLVLEVVEKQSLLKPEWQESAPEEISGIYNRFLFLWMNKLIIRGYNALLTLDVLLPIDQELLDCSDATAITKKWAKANKKSPHALLGVIFWHYKGLALSGVPPRLLNIVFEFSQPFLVQSVLAFLARPVGPDTLQVAGGLTAAYALVYCGIAVCFSWYEHRTYRLATAIRGSLVSMIFDKTLRISTQAVNEAEAITHMSADIERIGLGIVQVHKLYGSIIELGVIIWLLARFLGVAAAATAGYIAVCVVAGMFMATIAGNAQGPWLEAISKRLAVTSSYVTSLKGIRLSGLSEKARIDLRELREQEIEASLVHRLYNIFVLTISFASTACAPPIGFAVFVVLARAHGTATLDSSLAFAALTVFFLLEAPLIVLIEGYESFQSGLVAFTRIQEYLESEEREDYRALISTRLQHEKESEAEGSSEIAGSELEDEKQGLVMSSNLAVRMSNFSAAYSKDESPVVQKLDFEAQLGHITMIVGAVGCGKTTFLKAILGEMPIVSGDIAISEQHAAYCSQSPWIPSGTVRQCILGQQAYEPRWYHTVVRACNLEIDFSQFPSSDMTTTGNSGCRLSGGQKGRIALARAIYSRETIIVLDDCLNGLDATTESQVLQTVFGSNGLLRSSGITTIMATSSASHLQYADHIVVLSEAGEIAAQGSYETLALSKQILAEKRKGPQEHKDSESAQEVLEEMRRGSLPGSMLPIPVEDCLESARSAGDWSIYLYYFNAAGWQDIGIWFLIIIAFVFTQIFPSYWLVIWTDYNKNHPNQHLGFYLGIYGMIAGLQVLFMFAAEWLYSLKIVPTTGRRLHENLLKSTLGATTAFLTSTETGSIVNRFGQDLQVIDNDLQLALVYFAAQAVATFGQMISLFVGSGYFSATIPLLFVVLYFVQRTYLRTSRQIRVLDIEAKAPLLSVFLETLSGLSSIRAYGWTGSYQESNREALDRSQKPYYLLWTAQRYLTLILGLTVAGLAIVLVGLVLHVHGSTTNYLATSLFNIVGFGATVESLIQSYTQLEMALGAVARVKRFAKETPLEDDLEHEAPVSEDWPLNGDIRFHSVSASYDGSSNMVLQNVDLNIHDGERVAICGRSGSGKSSLIATLLRILQLDTGSIVVDGVDLATLRKQRVRERFNTMTQDALILQGSIRTNLDPFDDFTQDENLLLESLRQVHLYDILLGKPNATLDDALDEKQLSHGQKQLFSLARAVVASSCFPVVIIDEATSGLDHATEKLMSDVILSSFRGKTVIMIAHTLELVLGFDRVAILDHGRIVEFDSPATLLGQEGSAFKALWEASGA